MFRYIFIFISLILTSDTFDGQVIDTYKNPIHAVNIQVLGSDIGVAATADGYFYIPNPDQKRTIDIKLSHIAYQSKIVTIDSGLNDLTIVMYENILEVNRIVVTGTKSIRHIKDTPVLTHVITNADITQSSYIGVKEMLEIALPNVQAVASNHGDDRVKVQGLDNKYMAFLVDGDRITGEYAGNIDFSMFNLSNIDKIEVVEGAMSTLYGSSAMAGVVNILTKKHKSPYWLNFSLLDDSPIVNSFSMNSGFNYKKINYTLDFVYKASDGYDLTPQSFYSKTLEQYYDEAFQHKLIYTIKDNHNIEFYYKDYYSGISRYTEVFDQLIFDNTIKLDAPLNRYEDFIKKIKYNYLTSKMRLLKWSYIEERYSKFYFYPYYNSDSYVENGEMFKQGDLSRKEFNFEFSYESKKHRRLIGFEFIEEDYSAYNIYDLEGSLLHESIFSGIEKTKKRSNNSLYIHDEWQMSNNNQLTFGFRYTQDKSAITKYTPKILSSLSYLMKMESGYNYRFSYSSGYRNPSIKELYYQWTDHEPHIYGDPNLKSSRNNYLSISLDKRSQLNDFSVDFYNNNISNMISTEYDYPTVDTGGLYYRNYDNVVINGINVHYFRKISNKLNLKFVYNFTDASSESDEILEGISKHALRMNLSHNISDKFKMIINIKYNGEKFNFDQEQDHIGGASVKKLDDYFISDMYFILDIGKSSVKFGAKNIFHYRDYSRISSFSPDVLNNYDPGRRFFIEYSLSLKGAE